MAKAANKGFDLSEIPQANDTAKIELYHPNTGETLYDAEGQPMWIEVYGEDSEHSREVSKKFTDRMLQKAQRNGRMNINMTADELEAQSLEVLAKNVKDWNIVLNGKIECTEANAKGLFADYRWVREQVAEGRANRANFTTS